VNVVGFLSCAINHRYTLDDADQHNGKERANTEDTRHGRTRAT